MPESTYGNGIYTSGDISTTLENLTVSVDGQRLLSILPPSIGKEVDRSRLGQRPGIRVSSDSKFGDFHEFLLLEQRSRDRPTLSHSGDNQRVSERRCPQSRLRKRRVSIIHVISLASKSGNTLSAVDTWPERRQSRLSGAVWRYTPRPRKRRLVQRSGVRRGGNISGKLGRCAGQLRGKPSAGSLEIVALTAITRYEDFSDSLGSLRTAHRNSVPINLLSRLEDNRLSLRRLNFRFKDSRARNQQREIVVEARRELSGRSRHLSDSGGFTASTYPRVRSGRGRCLDLYNSSTGASIRPVIYRPLPIISG